MIRNRVLLRSLLSYVPLALKWMKRGPGSKGTGGTSEARYCYCIWLRHLVALGEGGMKAFPSVVAEIGPGDSFGTGLASLLTGAEHYHALDIIRHVDQSKNLKILDELVELFARGESIPDDVEFPHVYPKLPSYAFPLAAIQDERWEVGEWMADLKNALLMGQPENDRISYHVPWDAMNRITPDSVDLVFSQAVMEHVTDLPGAYKKMFCMLKPGGYMSHEIDYSAHEIATIWNEHWTLPAWLWRVVLHGRSYPINRYPHSYHMACIKEAGFQIVMETKPQTHEGILRRNTAADRRYLDSDFLIKNAFIIAKKPQ